jgi:hypothetical protein
MASSPAPDPTRDTVEHAPGDRDAPRDPPGPVAHGAALLYPAVRAARGRVRGWRTTLGLVVLAGAALAAVAVVLFAWLAHWVVAGRTQPYDEAALRWLGAHRGAPWLQGVIIEVTFLGTMTVVVTLAAIVALFLTLARQRASAALLLWATSAPSPSTTP